MIEIWEVNGVRYDVNENNKARFLKENPTAELVSEDTNSSFGRSNVQSRGSFSDPEEVKEVKEVNWGQEIFGDTWFGEVFGRGVEQSQTSGEANTLWMEGSNVTEKSINDYIAAKQQSAENYTSSKKMDAFQEKYRERGASWTAFFKGVKEDPGIMAELFVQSLGTQAGTLVDDAKSQYLAGGGVTAGFLTGFKQKGSLKARLIKGTMWGLAGGMGTLTVGMETALTFGEIIDKELEARGKEFNNENIKELLEGPDGDGIRNKAIARGIAIGTIEALTMGVSGKVTTSVLKTGSGVGTKLLATTAGVATEAVGGGLGEVAGMYAADQEFDAAEIGFEAITGTVTAPGSVGLSLLTYKPASYKLNKESVSYAQMKKFVDEATDLQIATANIQMENDLTGLDVKAYEKQQNAVIDSSIDEKITDVADREKLIALEKERQQLQRDKKKEGSSQSPGNKENIERVDAEIETIINKYAGAVGIYETKQGQEVMSAVADNVFEANLEFAKKHSSIYGLEVNDSMSIKEIQKYLQDNNLDASGVDSDGFIHGDQIIINRTVAKNTGAVNVGNHELLHGIIKKAMGDEKISSEVISGLKEKLGTQWKVVEEKIYATDKNGVRLYDDAYLAANPDEWITMLSDAIQAGDVTFNDDVWTKIGDMLAPILRKFGFKKIGFDNAQSAYNFLKEYNKSIHKGALSTSITKATGTGGVTIDGSKFSKQVTDRVNQLGRVDEDGNNLQEKGTGNFYYQAEAEKIVKEIKEQGYFDGLIKSKYKADKVPANFVSDVMTQLTPDIKNFKPEQNDSLFAYLNSRVSFRAGDVYNKIYKGDDAIKGAKDIGETTKEGEVKTQVAAEKSAEMKAFETEDLSPAARAKKKADKAKGKEKLESKFRKKLGIKTGSELYIKVLDSARKALLTAYEAGTSVRNIQIKLRNEANVYLFKTLKDFLGTKKYISNLKEFRIPIMEAIFTADFVQMERNTPENERVFTRFVRKLTSKKEVQDAVDQNLLPASALNIIDKGTAVSLYEKVNPSESKFMSYFDIPTINPVTQARSGKRGTRKDALAKAMAGALSYDATMEVAQESEIISKRETLAELRGESLAKDNLEVLAAAIGRNPNVKFSKSDANAGVDILEGRNKNDGYGGKNWQKFIDDPKITNRTKWEVQDEYLKRHTEQNDAISDKELAKLDYFKNGKKRKTKIRTYKKYEIIAKQRTEKIIKNLGLNKEGYIVENLSEKDNNPDIRITRNGKTVLAIEIKGNTARGVSVSFNYKKDSKGLTKGKRAAEKQETENYNKKEQSLIKDSNNVFDKMIAFIGESQIAYSRFKNLQITVEGVKKIKEKGLHLDIYKNKYFITTEDVANSYTQKKGSDGSSRTSHVVDLGNAGMFVMDNSSELTIKGLQKFSRLGQ